MLANLSTEETQAARDLAKLSSTTTLTVFFGMLMAAINRRQVTKNEEFILNAISCTTNMLFYDTQATNILTNTVRCEIFKTMKPYLLTHVNEEIQIESVRVISNLSRHCELCNTFLEDSQFIQTLCVVLEHSLRDLVFYSVGIIINISLHGKGE